MAGPLVSVLLLSLAVGSLSSMLEVNLTVPRNFVGSNEESYACTVVELPVLPHKLVGVVPLAEQSVVHHILLYGCEIPHMKPPSDGSPVAWDCMYGAICDSSQEIIYGWGRNAPHLELPPGVGFSVGTGTSIRYIVAQVHYLGKRPSDDASGVSLLLKPHATPYAAGLIAYAAGFTIRPHVPSTKVENACCYQGHQPVTTFAFRVHTHTLGKSVYMERPAWNHSGLELIAANNPQLPQAFYPVAQKTIWPGDVLKVTCDFDSTSKDTVTMAGSTHGDEMCNMYMMVYAPHPFIVFCTGSYTVNDATPGNIRRSDALRPDPSFFWLPPAAEFPSPALVAARAVLQPIAESQPLLAAQLADVDTAGQAAGVEGKRLGDVTGVTLAGDGSLWALYRGSRHWEYSTFSADNTMADLTSIPEATLVQLDTDTGAVLQSLAPGLFSMPHMVTADQQGNLWVADVGRHQVLKISPSGVVLLAVGTPMIPQHGDGDGFCKPTQVAVARDGTFYVSDGYCNSRVARFSADGKLIGSIQVPRPHSGGDGVVHSVMLNECQDQVWVASREDGKVYVFDMALKQLKQTVDVSRYGRVWSIVMGPYGLPLALAWDTGKDATLVNLDFVNQQWVIPGMTWPHDIALGAAPLVLSGAADRLFALYVAPVCSPPGCGPLRRMILADPQRQMPNASTLISPMVLMPGSTAVIGVGKEGGDSSTAASQAAWSAVPALPINASSQLVAKDPALADKLISAIDGAQAAADTHSPPAAATGQASGSSDADGVMIADDAADIEEAVTSEDVESLSEYVQTHPLDASGDGASGTLAGSSAGDGDASDGTDEEYAKVSTEGVSSSNSVGPGSAGWARVAALGVFALLMCVVVALLSLKGLRLYYTGGMPPGGAGSGPGKGAHYQQASIDELLEESAKLEGIEAGGSALSSTPGHPQYPQQKNPLHAHGLRSATNGRGVYMHGSTASIAMTTTRHDRARVPAEAASAGLGADEEGKPLLGRSIKSRTQLMMQKA